MKSETPVWLERQIELAPWTPLLAQLSLFWEKLGKCEKKKKKRKKRKETHQAAVSCQKKWWDNFIWKWECCHPSKNIWEQHQRACSNWMSLTGAGVDDYGLRCGLIASLDIHVFWERKEEPCNFALSHVQWGIWLHDVLSLCHQLPLHTSWDESL